MSNHILTHCVSRAVQSLFENFMVIPSFKSPNQEIIFVLTDDNYSRLGANNLQYRVLPRFISPSMQGKRKIYTKL